ncbi:MAG: hypothetical protein NT027_05410 [Proteobacteria bacterium]|nr:hypothetical protein [Pseudomonadota bacterium]
MHSLVKFIVRASWCVSVLAFLITSNSLMAGHSVGGGGTGVACFDTNGRVASIETYDFFFGRKLGRMISLESTSQDYRDIAKVSLDRLAVLSPKRAKTYQDQIAMFENPSESSFLSDSSIFHVPDLGQPALEPGDGCKYVQIVYQQEPRFPKDKRYLVNKYY